MKRFRSSALSAIVAAVVLMLVGDASAADDPFAEVAAAYDKTAHPLMRQFCLECHSTEAQEGELDLEQFSTFTEARHGGRTWQSVREMLDNGEMPPKDHEPQPTAEQRKQLRDWVDSYLNAEALANAGDPGPVVLRRLSNAQYEYTIHDLTGIDLDPTREFPVDGAAGEGFTNTGNALVMSPALLTKYLDAGKEIAAHAVLLPDGFRFSSSKSRADWSNNALAEIREFYGRYAAAGKGTHLSLQGVQVEANAGGRLNVAPYLAATVAEREAIRSNSISIADAAKKHGLNAKYLGILWSALNDEDSSLLLDSIRKRWQTAEPQDVEALAADVAVWQKSLVRFSSVGHIGKVGGPKAWQEPVTPLASNQEVRIKPTIPAGQRDVVLYLVTGDAGDGADGDVAVWQRPRIVAPGRPELLLRDVREFTRKMTLRREQIFASSARALRAAEEASQSTEQVDLAALAKKYEVESQALSAWLSYLGVGSGASIQLEHFTTKLTTGGGYDFVQGWGVPETPNVYANSTNQHVRIPGNMKPHGVVVHPAPTTTVAVGWQSPIAGTLQVKGQVTHAHPECGNGVTWLLELRRGAIRQRLATGIAQGGQPVAVGPIDNVTVQPGDLISLIIGARDENHSCDLTDVELELATAGDDAKQWNLTKEVSSDVLAGNPHNDQYGNAGVWHFYTEQANAAASGPVIPAGSLLARWQVAKTADERGQLAEQIQTLLTSGPAADAAADHPDTLLYRQLASLGGPLLLAHWKSAGTSESSDTATGDASYGLDPAMFGKHPDGSAIDADSLCVQGPSVLEVKLPAELIAGGEFVAEGSLHPEAGDNGSIQMQAFESRPSSAEGLLPVSVQEGTKAGTWTSNNAVVTASSPVLVRPDSAAAKRFEQSFEDFRKLFPAALCYTEIVPVDEVVTLTLYHREDEALQRLMLDDAQIAELDRLWAELHFVSRDAITLVDAFQQLLEYASQDGDPSVFEPLREPINQRAEKFRQALVDAEPKQLEQLIEFAGKAYRRPLAESEAQGLRELYQQLRERELSHDEAFRFTMARVFVAPAFLYRLEAAPEGAKSAPVSDWELANRLSYFLWSSQPDEELRAAAASGTLRQPEVLKQHARRMMKSSRVQRLATEFACQWLHIYDFDALDEKSPEHFPEFADLRGDMYRESILFFADLFQRDASVLSLFDADHTFVNKRLADFYGIPADQLATPAAESLRSLDGKSTAEDPWYRVDGIGQYGRGGILGLSTTLAKNSGASRSSPILRGNWVSEALLGQKLPNPPKDVPPFPETADATLTVRQLTELHTSDARCATCHSKIDHFGFALENFDAIGRRLESGDAGQPLDVVAKTPDGHELNGLFGLRSFLLEQRRDVVLRQFCRKLLGYALGRGVQLSDEPLLDDMQKQLRENEYRFSVAVETILKSQQFREIRGRDVSVADSH